MYTDLFVVVLAPLRALAQSTSRLFWLYLLTAGVIALVANFPVRRPSLAGAASAARAWTVSLRSTSAMARAPRRSSSWQTASPMPLAAPVTTATWFLISIRLPLGPSAASEPARPTTCSSACGAGAAISLWSIERLRAGG